MQTNQLKKYIGKKVIVRIGAKNSEPAYYLEYQGAFTKWVKHLKGKFVDSKIPEGKIGYVQMEIHTTKQIRAKNEPLIIKHKNYFRVVLQIAKIQSVKVWPF